MPNQLIDQKAWLKEYWSRESTYSTYPKDCQLPICTLTELGLYYDSMRKSLKCSECTFEYANIYTDSLDDLLTKHYKHSSSTCSYSNHSLEFSLNLCLKKLDILDMDLNNKPSTIVQHNKSDTKRLKLNYHLEEIRFKSFENCKLLLDTQQLAANGFYRVTINDTENAENNYLFKIANSLDTKIIHIKCFFCKYECIVFKKSLLNSYFKSPFDEHKEKSEKYCPIFTGTESYNYYDEIQENDVVDFKTNLIKYEDKLKWLQCLYDFETTTKKNAIDMLVNSHNFSQLNDVQVKETPKILLSLLNNFTQTTNSNNLMLDSTSMSKTGSNAIVYMPGNDFNKLQNVLVMSDSVISERAYHPAYALYQTRLETFKEWPATLSQQPSDLARAGFYYFGIKDMVKCFFCNGGLKNWDHNDDPFQDHVRWFPKCQFIRQLMGAEYVEQIREKYKNMDSGFTNEYNNTKTHVSRENNNSGKNNANINSSNVSKRQVSPRTLNSRLDCFIVRKICDSTNSLITRDSLKQAIELKLSASLDMTTYGDDFKSPIEMAKMAYDLDKAKKDKLDQLKSLSDLIVCNLPCELNTDCIRQYFLIKYCLSPSDIKLVKHQNSSCFALISLFRNDLIMLDEVINDLNGKKFPIASNSSNLMVCFKTNWIEISENFKLNENNIQINQSVSSNLNNSIKKEPFKASNFDALRTKLNKNEEDDTSMMTANNKIPTNSDEAAQLKEENERLKSERLCVICLDKSKNIIFLPCAHLAACLECSFSLQNCPMCRTKIQATVRTFT